MSNDLGWLETTFQTHSVSVTLTSSEENLCFMMLCVAAEWVGLWRGLVGNDGIGTPTCPVARRAEAQSGP